MFMYINAGFARLLKETHMRPLVLTVSAIYGTWINHVEPLMNSRPLLTEIVVGSLFFKRYFNPAAILSVVVG